MTIDYLQFDGKQHGGASIACKLDFARFEDAMEFFEGTVKFVCDHRAPKQIDFVPMGA